MTAQNRVVGPDGHVDVDVLSDLVEGLLSAAETAEAEAHLAECAECRDTRDALAEVCELLGGQPAEPMPEDVFARIESALADAAAADRVQHGGEPGGAERRGEAEVPAPRPSASPDLGALPPPRPHRAPEALAPVVDLHEVRRRRRLAPGLLGAAAAVAALLLFVGLIASGGLGGSSSDNADSKGAANAPALSQDQASTGKPGNSAGSGPPAAAAPSASSAAALPEYRDATLDSQVAALVERQAAAGFGTDSSESTKSGATTPELPSSSGRGAAQKVPDCVTAAAGIEAANRTPIAAEQARYLGQVVYVLVYGVADGNSVDAVVVSASCSTAALQSASRSPASAGVVLLTRNIPLRPAASP